MRHGPGTHWVAWYKNGKTKIYFDSYGVQPPIEVYIITLIKLNQWVKYFAVTHVYMFLKNSVRVINSKAF